jgi:hypothetical protein
MKNWQQHGWEGGQTLPLVCYQLPATSGYAGEKYLVILRTSHEKEPMKQ